MAKVNWNDDNTAWLIENYPKKSTRECANHFGISDNAIRQKAYKIGLKKGRYFTEEEKKYINDSICRISYAKIAKKLGRSYDSIKRYAYMNCNNMIGNDKNKISTTEAGRLVGRSRPAITNNWFKRGLKYKAVGGIYLIKVNDLFEFMKDNQDLWKPSECEEWFFQNEQWFLDRKKQEFDSTIKARWGEYYNV